MKAFLMNILSGTLGRGIRATVSMGIAMAAAKFKDNAWYVSAGPLLQMASKALRDKYPSTWWELLPF